jgi:xanthine/uracil permease
MEAPQRVELIVGIDERLKWWQNIVYGIQQLTVDTTILIIPVLLARALKLPPQESRFVVQAALTGAGIVTIAQSMWILRLPVLQGPAIVFVSVVPAVVATSGLAAAWTGMVIASLIAAVLSLFGFWGRVRLIFGAAPVYGVVILMAALTIASAIVGQVVGFPRSPTFGQPFNFVLASIPFVVALAVILFIPRSFLRLVALLLGAVAAILVALISGRMNFGAAANAPWFGFSVFFPFGFQFDLGATLVMLLAYIADLGQVVGSYILVGEEIGKQKVSNKRIDGGILTESLGSAISAAFGGVPTVTYNQNIGALAVTRIGSRFVFATAGVILLIFGQSPKIGAFVAAIPGPVVGGLLLVTIAALGMQAIRVLGSMPQTDANIFIAGTAIIVGIGVTALPHDFIAMLPPLLRPFISTGIVVAFVIAAVMHTIFNVGLRASEPEKQRQE